MAKTEHMIGHTTVGAILKRRLLTLGVTLSREGRGYIPNALTLCHIRPRLGTG